MFVINRHEPEAARLLLGAACRGLYLRTQAAVQCPSPDTWFAERRVSAIIAAVGCIIEALAPCARRARAKEERTSRDGRIARQNRTRKHQLVTMEHHGMTMDWPTLLTNLSSCLSSPILYKVRGVNRVVYGITSKPLSPIEWE